MNSIVFIPIDTTKPKKQPKQKVSTEQKRKDRMEYYKKYNQDYYKEHNNVHVKCDLCNKTLLMYCWYRHIATKNHIIKRLIASKNQEITEDEPLPKERFLKIIKNNESDI